MGVGRVRELVGRRIQGQGGGAQANDPPLSPQEFSLEGLGEEQLMWEGEGVLLAVGTQMGLPSAPILSGLLGLPGPKFSA